MAVSQSDLNDIVASLFVAVIHGDGERWRREVGDAKAICTEEEQNFIWDEVQAAVSRHRRNKNTDEHHPLRREDGTPRQSPYGSGVRFKVDGITERALKALASRQRGEGHHYDLALADLQAAIERIPVREAALREAEDNFLVGDESEKARLEKAVAQATHNLALANRAKLVCLSKLQRTYDPRSGKPRPGPSGRAPRFMAGPEDQLQDEYLARERLANAKAFMASGEKLPEAASTHMMWERLRFPYYVDCVGHEALRFAAMPDSMIKMLPDHVLAFCLYVYREASKQGVPLVVTPSTNSVQIEHAIWRDRLTEGEYLEISTFLLFAGKRLQLSIHWDAAYAETYEIEPPTSGAVDYAHIIRGLKRHNWRHPNATDEELFEEMSPASERETVSTPEFIARMEAERAKLAFEEEAYQRYLETGEPQLIDGEPIEQELEWIDPMPRLATTSLRWSLVRLFHMVRQFTKVPPARLSARSVCEAWYVYPSSYIVSVDLIAGELFDAIQTGDLDCAVWWDDNLLPRIADDLVGKAIAKVERMLKCRGGPDG